jgi:TolA-binding protein
LLREYPEEQNNDQVLYQLARALEGGGEWEQSTETLSRVAAAGPAGDLDLYSDARFRRGEALFSRGEYDAAESQYRSVVVRGPDSPVYAQALYKLGWTLYKQGRYTEATTTLGSLLDHLLPTPGAGDAQLAGQSAADREQIEDALRAMNLSFSSLRGAQAVSDYFDRSGRRSYESLVFQRLGELYLSEERYHDAAQCYLTLALRRPGSLEAPGYHANAIAIYRRAGFQGRALEIGQDYALRYGPGSAFWEAQSEEALAPVRSELQPLLIELALHYDGEARSTEDAAAYAEALAWYQRYLTSFDDADRAAEIRFRLAELLYAREDFARAAQEYERSAYGYGSHPYAADAGYGAVLAAEATLVGVPAARREQGARFVASAERFAERYPTHPQAAAALVRAAQELLAAGEPASASRLAEHALRTAAPAAGLAQRNAWTTHAEAQVQLGDLAAAERAYRAALAVPSEDAAESDALRASLAALIYRRGEESLAEGRPADAAAHFSRVAADAPESSIRPQADYQAAMARLTTEDWRGAAQTLEAFRRQYPQHPLYADATRKLAIAYKSAGEPAAAARTFESLAATSGNDPRRRAALVEAAALYRQAGRLNDAVRIAEQYLDQYPAPTEESIQMRSTLAALSQEQGNSASRHRWLQSVIDGERTAGSMSTPRMRLLAAEAALGLAAVEQEAFRRVRLVEPLQARLTEKTRHMRSALELYDKAGSYGISEQSSAATFHSAELHRELARDLRTSQRPSGLAAQELTKYEALLEEQAAPFTRKAIEIHESNLKRIPLGVYDPWIARSIDELAVLEPLRYARQEVSERFVRELR